MILSNLVKITEPYSGKSKFEVWNNMDIGDIYEISIELKNEINTRGMHVPMVKIFNITKNTKGTDSYNSFANKLLKISYEPYKK